MTYAFTAAFMTVLAVELIGDRSLYAISALAGRFPPARVFAGIGGAFAVKMLLAVIFGRALGALPPPLLTAASVATFLTTAIVIWRRGDGAEPSRARAGGGVAAAFGTIFFSEWADAGQITAATLVARYNAPLAVWLGATLALVTKGAIALAAGAALRRSLPAATMRRVAATLCLVLGALALT